MISQEKSRLTQLRPADPRVFKQQLDQLWRDAEKAVVAGLEEANAKLSSSPGTTHDEMLSDFRKLLPDVLTGLKNELFPKSVVYIGHLELLVRDMLKAFPKHLEMALERNPSNTRSRLLCDSEFLAEMRKDFAAEHEKQEMKVEFQEEFLRAWSAREYVRASRMLDGLLAQHGDAFSAETLHLWNWNLQLACDSGDVGRFLNTWKSARSQPLSDVMVSPRESLLRELTGFLHKAFLHGFILGTKNYDPVIAKSVTEQVLRSAAEKLGNFVLRQDLPDEATFIARVRDMLTASANDIRRLWPTHDMVSLTPQFKSFTGELPLRD